MGLFGSAAPQWGNMNGLGNIIQQFSTPENQQMASLLGVNMRPLNQPMPQQMGQQAPQFSNPTASALNPGDVAQGMPMPNLMDPRTAKALRPPMWSKDGRGWKMLGVFGDALQTAGGGRPTYLPYLTEQQKLQQEHDKNAAAQALELQKFDWQRKKDNREIRTIGRSLLTVPVEGDPSVIYTGPTDAQEYATSIGINPGDPNYISTIKDKELGAYGPTAFDQKRSIEDTRFGHRVELRGQPTYANLHPRPSGGGRGNAGPRDPRSVGEAIAPIIVKMRNGIPLTPADQQALSYYGGRGRRTVPVAASPQARPAKASAPVRVSTPDEARRLPPGTVFQTPDGRTKVR